VAGRIERGRTYSEVGIITSGRIIYSIIYEGAGKYGER